MNGRVFIMAGLLACGAGVVEADVSTIPPVYASVQTEAGSFFAVRPFYSRTETEGRVVQDLFWPLYSRKTLGDEQTSRTLIFWFTHRFDTTQEEGRVRRWLLPIWFHGRDAQGEDYHALFPVGGTIHEFLGRDTIRFVLFPIYAESRVNEVETTSVLWPIYSRTRGPGIERDRVFPLAGRSILEDQYEKRFVLWPFWTSADYFYPGDSGRVWIFFPFYGRADMEREQTRWVLPPFFRFTEGERQRRVYCPWPFYQRIEGGGRDRLSIWPLWGRSSHGNGRVEKSYFLWPVFGTERAQRGDHVTVRHRATPVFAIRRDYEADGEEGEREIARHWRIWPLMSWRRTEDASRFRMLELWPIPDNAPVERNWAPLWTLYRRAETEGVIERDLLWFLWNSREESRDGRRQWALLGGLVSYKQEAHGDGRLRLFRRMKTNQGDQSDVR